MITQCDPAILQMGKLKLRMSSDLPEGLGLWGLSWKLGVGLELGGGARTLGAGLQQDLGPD